MHKCKTSLYPDRHFVYTVVKKTIVDGSTDRFDPSLLPSPHDIHSSTLAQHGHSLYLGESIVKGNMYIGKECHSRPHNIRSPRPLRNSFPFFLLWRGGDHPLMDLSMIPFPQGTTNLPFPRGKAPLTGTLYVQDALYAVAQSSKNKRKEIYSPPRELATRTDRPIRDAHRHSRDGPSASFTICLHFMRRCHDLFWRSFVPFCLYVLYFTCSARKNASTLPRSLNDVRAYG